MADADLLLSMFSDKGLTVWDLGFVKHSEELSMLTLNRIFAVTSLLFTTKKGI